jgi:hypothetical protein
VGWLNRFSGAKWSVLMPRRGGCTVACKQLYVISGVLAARARRSGAWRRSNGSQKHTCIPAEGLTASAAVSWAEAAKR